MAVLTSVDGRFAARCMDTERGERKSSARMVVNFCWRMALILCCASQFAEVTHGQSGGLTKYEIEAAFLYNFAKFVDWPPEAFSSPTDGLRLCILGDHPSSAELQPLIRGKMIGGHPVQAQRVEVAQVTSCHILFIGVSESVRTQEVLRRVDGGSVLTVGETAEFVGQGGMISLVVENNRIRFEVNLRAAQAARLKLSSKLLTLAKSVQM